MKSLFKKKNFYLLGLLLIALIFIYITYVTPLAGDDWGYALNGSKGNPFKLALEFYNSWSGRFFSEFWGFLVAPRKWLWNILNPLLFVCIYFCLYKLGHTKTKPVLSTLLILAMMLSVHAYLRMQTYTWIMGTTYVVPLALSLVYFCIYNYSLSGYLIDKRKKTWMVLSNVLVFIIGLMMENIAATMIVAIAVLCIYSWFEKKDIFVYLVINLVVSIIAFAIMRLSPGSTYRLLRDSAKWASMSVFEKLVNGYPTFIKQSFLNNKYAIALFSIVLALNLFSNKKVSKTYKWIGIIILALGTINVFSSIVLSKLTFLYTEDSLYSLIFWPIYVLNAFLSIQLTLDEDDYRLKALFFLMVGGCSALVMIFSPIYGERSSLYLVYYLILTSLVVLNNFSTKKMYEAVLFFILLFITVYRSVDIIKRYRLVAQANVVREAEIQYYIDHPSEKEAWITRYPIDTIHSIDIESTDTYHLETFKTYFGLPQDADKIIFYYKD